MSRIDKSYDSEEVKWNIPEVKEHPDYKRNLQVAENFVKKTEKSLLRGMSVKVCDSEHLSKSLMMVAWTPPKEAPVGRCATPINLHQNNSDVSKQIEGIFNTYMKVVGKFEKDHPKQPEFLDTSLKV